MKKTQISNLRLTDLQAYQLSCSSLAYTTPLGKWCTILLGMSQSQRGRGERGCAYVKRKGGWMELMGTPADVIQSPRHQCIPLQG